MRSIGNSIAMVVNWLFVYVVVLITPSGKLLTQGFCYKVAFTY